MFVGVVSVSFTLVGALVFAPFILVMVLKNPLIKRRSKCKICPPLISKEHHEACEHPVTRGYCHDMGLLELMVFLFSKMKVK